MKKKKKKRARVWSSGDTVRRLINSGTLSLFSLSLSL